MQTGRATTEVIARVVGYVAVILATKAAPATFLHEDIEGQVRKKPLNPVPVRDVAAFDPVPHPRWLAVTRSRIMHIAQLCHAFALAVLLGAGAALGGHRAAVAAEGDFAGPVDIGGSRHMYLECRGTGGPTVILESGYHDSAQPWTLNDAFPPAVLIGVAGFAKVCAYDRPGTLLYTDPPRITDRSSPVPMPRTAAKVVSDLHTLLTAAQISGPYILVAHSLGGLFARLYSQTYPEQVRGLVLVDAFPVELPAMFGSQWPAYRQVLNNPLPQFANNPEFEQVDVDASIAEIEKAPPLRRMPLAVLTKTEPFARPPNLVGFSFADLERFWPKAAQGLVKLEPDTPHIFATGSDHYIQVHQPDLVIQSIRLIIERAKQK